jgi:hypothetical protein
MNENGYEWYGSEYKRKSRLYPRTILVTARNGKKLKKVVDEKQVIFYSEKYAKKAKADREKTIAKAIDIIHRKLGEANTYPTFLTWKHKWDRKVPTIHCVKVMHYT